MRYLLAILLPPVAVLICGKPFQFLINLILTLFFWFPGAIHACLVVSATKADERNQKLINAIQSSGVNAPRNAPPSLPSSSPPQTSVLVKILAGAAAVVILGVVGSMFIPRDLAESTEQPSEGRKSTSSTANPSSSDASTPGKKEKKVAEAVKPTPTLPKYSIIEDTSMATIKRSVDVRLEQKISEDELRLVAEKIKGMDSKKYERVFITYYLPHQTPGSGAWATTHYDPNIDVRVLGFGADEVPAPEQSDAPKADRVGRWEYSDAIGQVFTISRVGTGFTMTIEFQDGGKIVEPVTAQREGERVIVRRVEPNGPGDYWILDEEKNLLLMDSEGLIGKAVALPE
ncbi:MAG: YqaE/Pmp3 family membrane protein [Verrucomicrobiales bacterium]|nr:YqaE/Pmp3 family membrane protein [Verrucomicrobiales bacterium]